MMSPLVTHATPLVATIFNIPIEEGNSNNRSSGEGRQESFAQLQEVLPS